MVSDNVIVSDDAFVKVGVGGGVMVGVTVPVEVGSMLDDGSVSEGSDENDEDNVDVIESVFVWYPPLAEVVCEPMVLEADFVDVTSKVMLILDALNVIVGVFDSD